MKFLHTADIHYGATPDPQRPWGRERADAVKAGFERIIDACRTGSVDLLIISGGLFDGHPVQAWVDEVSRAFASIPETQVYIIAGEDDFLFENSPAADHVWPDNVHYCKDTASGPTVYEELGVSVTGISCGGPRIIKERLVGVKADESLPSILVLSGAALEEQDIPAGFTYAALGGKHSPLVLRDGALVNAGAPEPLGPADTGKHGYYIGEIDPKDKKLTALRFVRAKGVSYISLSVYVTPASTCAEVEDSIRKAIVKRGEENIYRLRLKGSSSPEVTFDLEGLKNEFRIDEITDETEPQYDYVQLFKEHPSDMIGFFVRDMNTADRTPLQTRALNYGVAALLKTADERESNL